MDNNKVNVASCISDTFIVWDCLLKILKLGNWVENLSKDEKAFVDIEFRSLHVPEFQVESLSH